MSNNKLLVIGICTIILGIGLFVYSINSYAQINSLSTKIDFEELDNNTRMPSSDKYYKYLSYAEILNQYLNKNKNLPIKNTSCAYLDYAQHNSISLYKLVYKGLQEDTSRREVAESNIQQLNDMLENYKTCPKTPQYKTELTNILDEIEKTKNIQKSFDPFIDPITPTENDIQPTSEIEHVDMSQYDANTTEQNITPTSDINQNAPILDEE